MPLSETWFLDGRIDFELQKYRLLAYLQDVNKHFNDSKLYPPLGDVIFHYQNLLKFKEHKQLLQSSFPKELSKVNLEKVKLIYKEMLQDDDIMQELEHITNYAIKEMKSTISNGTEIYEQIEQQLNIEPIGIVPLYKNEGYIMLKQGSNKDVFVYNYNISLFEHDSERYKSLRIKYINSWKKTITNTYEQIKSDIIRTIKTLPNPAVYCIASPIYIPIQETMLPIAKRMLMKHISAND